MNRPLPPLYLISDAERVGEERFLEVVEAAVSVGLRWVQVREPGWSVERVRALVVRLRERTPRALEGQVLIVVNRWTELVNELDLAGVHVGGGNPAGVVAARAALGPDRLAGYSAHRLDELDAVARAGASYVSYSPVFGAISKRHPLPPLGLEGLKVACKTSAVPVYALGGVRPEHAGELRRAEAAGAAMIGAILDAKDPGRAVAEFLEGWAEVRS